MSSQPKDAIPREDRRSYLTTSFNNQQQQAFPQQQQVYRQPAEQTNNLQSNYAPANKMHQTTSVMMPGQPPSKNASSVIQASPFFVPAPTTVQSGPLAPGLVSANASGNYPPIGSQPAPLYSVRNEFFSDKFDIVSEQPLNIKLPGEIHKSRNLMSGKEVFVHLIPLQESADPHENQSGNVHQKHLNLCEGILSVFESFHDGAKYILVSEPFSQTLDNLIGTSGVNDQVQSKTKERCSSSRTKSFTAESL